MLKTAVLRLSSWFEKEARVLPWRNNPSVYRVWISEIMLQQTQVATVLPYFERFVARFPDVDALARAPAEEVLRHWAGLGYYSRARNLHEAARRICAAGSFPRSREEWLEIPGVGPYTAGAILSIACEAPEPILDGNVERVLSRFWKVSRSGGEGQYRDLLWKLAREWVEAGAGAGVRPSSVNQALMELGALYCGPKKAACALCPIRALCGARLSGEVERYPEPKKKKEWIRVHEMRHAVFDYAGRVLVRKSAAGEWREGLWDFPAELAGGFSQAEYLGVIQTQHVVTRHKVKRSTHVWRIKTQKNAWANPSDMKVPAGSAFKRTLERIRERFPEVSPGSSALAAESSAADRPRKSRARAHSRA